nr:MAG TPA: hypothetical protein [Caudoviricetes sp.]
MIVSVRDKMLRRIGGVNHFVTHNKDYEIQFQFDDSWADVRHKMAVFAYEDGEYGSEIFDGEICAVPELPKEGRVYIGLKAGDELSTELLCVQVCKSANDVITDEYDVPDPKIYEQILDIINNLWGGGDTVYPSPVKFLASPSASKVGDLIRVKEVDENGDVTRTEGFDVGVELEKKIDAPQTAAVGEVLTVEKIGDDGKPKKWKTAPGVNITTELTQESTDSQVPSAKAAYDAIQNATDKDAVRFVAQKLTDTQKQQARENIGTIPKLFWKPWEEIAKSTVIDDSGNIGYKSITLPVPIKNKENIIYTSPYVIHLRGRQPDSFQYTHAFDLYELEDGDLYVRSSGKYFNIFIIEKTKIFPGVWNVTLQITRNSETPTEGMVLNSNEEVDFPIRLIGEDVPRTRYAKARTSNSKDLFLDNNGIGFVDPEISVVRNQNELRDELLSSAKTIICNYEDSVTDVFWIKSVENPAGGYLVNQGLGIKNGKIGTVDIVIDRSSANYFSGTFTPLDDNYTITLTTVTSDDGTKTYSIDKTSYSEILDACKNGKRVQLFLKESSVIVPLLCYNNSGVCFRAVMHPYTLASQYFIIVKKDNDLAEFYQSTHYEGYMGSPMVVSLYDEDDGTISSELSFEELLSAYYVPSNVVLNYNGDVWKDLSVTPDQVNCKGVNVDADGKIYSSEITWKSSGEITYKRHDVGSGIFEFWIEGQGTVSSPYKLSIDRNELYSALNEGLFPIAKYKLSTYGSYGQQYATYVYDSKASIPGGSSWLYFSSIGIGNSLGNKFSTSTFIIKGDGTISYAEVDATRVVIPQPTTAQPGQIVSVKSVDTSGKITETEAIPHPVLYVTISKTGNTNTSDKTFAEIKSAYDSGCSVFAVVDSFVLPLLAVLDNMACFCATTPDGELHRVSVLITESSVSLAYGSFVEGNQGVENAGKILGIGNDGNVVPEDKPAQALAGAAAPTTATAGVVGQEYYVIVDGAVTEMYVCTAVANGTYTWDKVEFGGGSYTAGDGIKIENGEISLNLAAWTGGSY